MVTKKFQLIIRIVFWLMLISFIILALNPFSSSVNIVRDNYILAVMEQGMDSFIQKLFSLKPFHFIAEYFPYNISGFVRLCLSKVAIGFAIGALLRTSYSKKILLLLVPISFVLTEFLQPLYLIGYFNIDSIIFYTVGYVTGITLTSIIVCRFSKSNH